ncbi:MAG: HDOD domain-containing protein [Magnetococcales bacterium]|nr:HDOD domain-containing protein [Magnetococcales bacterium]
MTNNEYKKIVKAVDKMPAFPNSVHQILALTSDINCPPKKLLNVVHHDPVLTLEILKIVNSHYFGLSESVVSINQAAVFIGYNTIKNLALGVAAMGILPKGKHAGLNMTKFLHHALATASICRLFHRWSGGSEAEATSYFVAGLLHDVGKVVLAEHLPDVYEKAMTLSKSRNIALHLAEQMMLGMDHCDVGAMLAEKWSLPTDIVAAIGQHHEEQLTGVNSVRECVIAANTVAKKMALGDSGNPIIAPLPAEVESYFGRDIDALITALTPHKNELDDVRSFLQA